MKIKLCAGWDSSKNITERLLNQFFIDKRDELIFVYDDSYDIIIFNNYITESVKKDSKSYLFFHEPSWSGNHQKTFESTLNTTICGYDSSIYSSCNFVESISHMFYGGAGSWREGNSFWTYNNLYNQKFIKNKEISCIASSIGSSPQQWIHGSIYKERYNLVQLIHNNYNNIINCFGGSVGSDLSLKKEGLINYKFSICIENTHEKNYISEKFYDSILTDTIPIYYGCKNIKNIWPHNGYILLESIDNEQYILDTLSYIINNADSIYDNLIIECQKIKYEFLHNKNLYSTIKALF
jgi:hypothetical protein